jgi:hypothetical protein
MRKPGKKVSGLKRKRKTTPKISNVLQYVHEPYKRVDKYNTCMAVQACDFTRCYRVLVVDRKKKGKRVDVVIPGTKGGRLNQVQLPIIRAFYVGSEYELDRYLRWLDRVGMVDAYGQPAELVVVEQYTHQVLSDLALLKNTIKLVLVRRGRFTDWGLFVDTPETKSKPTAWNIY